MNYLSELIFGKKAEPWENIPEPKVIEKHCLYYRPYSYSGMAPIGWWQDEWIREYKIQAIDNNQTYVLVTNRTCGLSYIQPKMVATSQKCGTHF